MKMNKKNKCECPKKENIFPSSLSQYSEKELEGGINHEPNKCEGTNKVRQYSRGGKKMWLCSRCCLLGDVEI